jgi:hypothetical protein
LSKVFRITGADASRSQAAWLAVKSGALHRQIMMPFDVQAILLTESLTSIPRLELLPSRPEIAELINGYPCWGKREHIK